MGRSVRSVLSHFANIIAFMTAVVAGGGMARAYPVPVDFDGSLLRWPISIDDPPITYAVEADRVADATVYAPAIDDAARMWSEIAGSYFRYQHADEGETPQVTLHLASTLDGSAYSAGYAIFDEYAGSTPKHCAIYVVVDDAVSYRSMAKTFLHELGHCAGLGHTLVPEAIMSYSLDKNSFALDLDDEAAVARLYPADGSQPKLPPGCAVGALPARSGTRGLLALLLLAPLLAAASVRVDRHARRHG
jgi:hypothetical protein